MAKHIKYRLLIYCLILVNVILRLIYAFYGYIPSEEGLMIFGQRYTYSGLLPFIHFNAWNSLLHYYVLGIYTLFIKPTILTQRFVGILLSLLVFYLIASIASKITDKFGKLITIILLAIGSLTYTYNSSVPYSEQTMTLFAVAALFLLTRRPQLTLNRAILTLILAALSFMIKIQALPAFFIIWLYVMYLLRKRRSQRFIVSLITVVFIVLVCLPFALSSWDNFSYSFLWPFNANNILIYQYGINRITANQFFLFILNLYKEYGTYMTLISALLVIVLLIKRKLVISLKADSFFLASLCISFAIILPAFIHKPPYSTYVYPALPILAYCIGYVISKIIQSLAIGRLYQVQVIIISIIFFICIQNIILFPHADYMKTAIKTITSTPYQLLTEISSYIDNNTSPKSEILAFYLPSVVGLDRRIPIDLNEGEGSLSVLSDIDSKKYHLTNITMLMDYIASKKAEAIIFNTATTRFFGINDQQKNQVMDMIDRHYYLAREFDNFSSIGNPRVKKLFIYLRKII